MDSRFQILDEILAHVRVIAARTEELLAPEEVATKLRLTGDQVRRKMKNGTFPKGVVWFEKPGLGPYFSWQALCAFIKQESTAEAPHDGDVVPHWRDRTRAN